MQEVPNCFLFYLCNNEDGWYHCRTITSLGDFWSNIVLFNVFELYVTGEIYSSIGQAVREKLVVQYNVYSSRTIGQPLKFSPATVSIFYVHFAQNFLKSEKSLFSSNLIQDLILTSHTSSPYDTPHAIFQISRDNLRSWTFPVGTQILRECGSPASNPLIMM